MEAFSLTLNISAKSLSNLTNKGSFGILRTSRFQNLLVARFDQELAQILRVKGKASISKSWRFFLSVGVLCLDQKVCYSIFMHILSLSKIMQKRRMNYQFQFLFVFRGTTKLQRHGINSNFLHIVSLKKSCSQFLKLKLLPQKIICRLSHVITTACV